MKEKETIKEFRDNALVDLHVHTCYSDGEFTPNELLEYAMKNHVGTLAITDHDTILGLQNIIYNTKETNYVKIIPGIELSVKINKGRMHILGYGIDIQNEELNQKMVELKQRSINSVLSIIAQIKKDYGIIFSDQEIEELVNANHNIGRPDIAKLCVKYGYASSIQEAFDKYLIEAYNKTRIHSKGLAYEECIKLILNSRGIPVLAHPHSLELTEKELWLLIKEMIEVGLKGIEVYHSNHTKEEMALYLKIANKYNLLVSGGSDFHGPFIKPDIEIGTGKNNNIKIKKLSILEYI